MSLKLNLGCGTFPFPFERDNEPERLRNSAMPYPDTVYEPTWINVDKFPAPGVQEQINLFRFPWVRSSNGSLFNDDSIDEIWCAHLIEHIPHEVKVARGLPGKMVNDYAELVENFDGFFVFFKEVWRILKPDGLIYLRFPYAVNYPALCDPTHTRAITFGTLGYLTPQNTDDPFDYNTGLHFEMHGGSSIRFTPEGEHQRKYLSEAGLGQMVRDNYNTVEEVHVTLRAIK